MERGDRLGGGAGEARRIRAGLKASQQEIDQKWITAPTPIWTLFCVLE